MIGTEIEYGIDKKGTVILVYKDAIASGTNEYVEVTMLLVKDEHGNVTNVYPRDVQKSNNPLDAFMQEHSKQMSQIIGILTPNKP